MRNARVQLALALIVAGSLIAGGVFLWRSDWGQIFSQREALETWLLDLGPWGPAAVVLGEIAQVLLAPVPGQIVGLVAGYLYGVWGGTALCLLGLTIGSWIAMWLARRLGRPLVERFVRPETLARLDRYAERRGTTALFLIFLIPFLPDDAACFVAGLTPLRISHLLLLATIGRIPGMIVSTWIGAQAHQLTLAQIVLLTGFGAILGVIVLRYQAYIERALFKLVDRWSPPEK